MACETCAASAVNGIPKGCKSNGHCASGGCNKLNTFDWLADIPTYTDAAFDIMEVSFNNGSRKDFFRRRKGISVDTADWVVVDAQYGQDIGKVTLSGELVKLQMRKKKVPDNSKINQVLRRATDRDLDKYKESKQKEYDILVKSRAMARQFGLEMKIGQVEVQADGKKVTFYYTADGRVDFRELIKEYAKTFHMKIEMRQIGARQEAGKIGGLGTCGRELCCSTWLTSFKTVSTSAARYQDLAINQAKLSGQCGRLKCCLNYELDTYLEALEEFPKDADKLKTKAGTAYLQKSDIFNRIMIFKYPESMSYYKLTVDQVKEIMAQNAKGEMPDELVQTIIDHKAPKDDFVDTVGHITLESLEKGNKRRQQGNRRRGGKGRSNNPQNKQGGPGQGGNRGRGGKGNNKGNSNS